MWAFALTIPDRQHSEDEERWITIGRAGLIQNLVVVVHTYRDSNGEEVIRLISARRAVPKERRQYMNLPGGPQ
jgi:uncharacterized DUF497 family protein